MRSPDRAAAESRRASHAMANTSAVFAEAVLSSRRGCSAALRGGPGCAARTGDRPANAASSARRCARPTAAGSSGSSEDPQRELPPDQREAVPYLHQKRLDVVEQGELEVALLGLHGETQELGVLGILDGVAQQLGVRPWKGAFDGGERVALAPSKVGRDLRLEGPARPTRSRRLSRRTTGGHHGLRAW